VRFLSDEEHTSAKRERERERERKREREREEREKRTLRCEARSVG
jgi:hypothetical protein